jgi:hypothetical protein
VVLGLCRSSRVVQWCTRSTTGVQLYRSSGIVQDYRGPGQVYKCPEVVHGYMGSSREVQGYRSRRVVQCVQE